MVFPPLLPDADLAAAAAPAAPAAAAPAAAAAAAAVACKDSPFRTVAAARASSVKFTMTKKLAVLLFS